MINRVRLLSFFYLRYFPFRKVRHSEVFIGHGKLYGQFRSAVKFPKYSYIDFNEILNSDTPRARVRSRMRFVRNTERDTVLTSYSENRSLSTLRFIFIFLFELYLTLDAYNSKSINKNLYLLSRGTFIYVLSFIRNRTQPNRILLQRNLLVLI